MLTVKHTEDTMPKGPNEEKRPADAIGLAVLIAKIATGEVDDAHVDDGKDPAAKALGKKGGVARAASMTDQRRAEIARKAAIARWTTASLQVASAGWLPAGWLPQSGFPGFHKESSAPSS